MFHAAAVSAGDTLWVGGGTDGADIQDSVLRLVQGGTWVRLSKGLSGSLASHTAAHGRTHERAAPRISAAGTVREDSMRP